MYRIKRKWRDLTTFKQNLGTGPAGASKISLILYFDYEREFGNPEAKGSADFGFKAIVDILRQHEIRANWNCVGQIAEIYSETIEALISIKQEISCHTYFHITPLLSDVAELSKDIATFKQVFFEKYQIDIKGFHSPRDAWSKPLIKILLENNFDYDFAVETKECNHNVCYISLLKTIFDKNKKRLLRIPSVSDDWMMISKKISSEDMLSHWNSFLNRKYHGKTIAIGFHPWVLGQSAKKMDMFKKFVDSLKKNDDLKLFTGSEVYRWYQN